MLGQETTVDVRFNRSLEVIQIPESVAKDAAGSGSSMIDSSELTVLAAAAWNCSFRNGAYVIEIGTYTGRTAAFLGRLLKKKNVAAIVCSIDPFEAASADSLNPQGSYGQYIATIKEAAVSGVCFPITAFSGQVASILQPNVDLLIVDGSHYYEHVSQDLNLYPEKVNPGGYLFVDDYSKEHYPDVVRAVDEFAASHPDFQLVHLSYFALFRRSGR